MKNEIITNVRFEGSICVINLKGEVTTFSETKIIDAYQTAIDQNASQILLDFKDVNYINSAGIAILIGVVTDSRKKSLDLHISSLTPHFKKIFKMVGLTQYTHLYDSEEMALLSMQNRT